MERQWTLGSEAITPPDIKDQDYFNGLGSEADADMPRWLCDEST